MAHNDVIISGKFAKLKISKLKFFDMNIWNETEFFLQYFIVVFQFFVSKNLTRKNDQKTHKLTSMGFINKNLPKLKEVVFSGININC